MPGDSIPKRLTSPGTPCVSGPAIMKSAAGSVALLIFGGDEVYPVASWENYRNRLVAPYRTAMNVSTAAQYQSVNLSTSCSASGE